MAGRGFKIVLTGETAIMSDYGGDTVVGFISALPEQWIRGLVEQRLFPTRSDAHGRMYMAPYGLCKVEATLLDHGFTRDEVIIADPRKLDRVIGPETKVLGITTMDPMGVSYGVGIVNLMLKALGIKFNGLPYISRSFFDVVLHPEVRKYRPKIVVGGPAAWQFIDTGTHYPLGVDTVFEGEFEHEGWNLIKMAVDGRPLPKVYRGMTPSVDEIPVIKTPSIGGIVEISRGCGRGCKFCTPTLLRWVSMPLDLIEKEVLVNIRNGANHIGLHSEEFFKYGSRDLFRPAREPVLSLLRRVERLVKEKSCGRDVRITTDFTTAVSVVTDPQLVAQAAEYINPGNSYSFIEMGIETGSPRLIDIIMPGKVKPFKASEYPDIVEQAIGVLNRWVVCGTIVMNFPGEREEDLTRSIELVERLKHYKVLIWTLPFIPMGGLRRTGWSIIETIFKDHLKRELLMKGMQKTFQVLLSLEKLPTHNMHSLIDRLVWSAVGRLSMSYIVRRINNVLSHTKFRDRVASFPYVYSSLGDKPFYA
ncbi:MAG: radical SAM protein [Nitrososphaerota archaeon]